MGRDSVYTGGVIAVREKRFLGDRLLRMCGGTAAEGTRPRTWRASSRTTAAASRREAPGARSVPR